MNSTNLIKAGAVLASLFCFAAGAVMIYPFFKTQKWDDITFFGFGLYFIGKGFFVGPMLISTLKDLRSTKTNDSAV